MKPPAGFKLTASVMECVRVRVCVSMWCAGAVPKITLDPALQEKILN